MSQPLTRFGQRGAIVRIRLRNFMTYDDTTLKPGPNLNMVLGPNGSGKSAIVCSIIVGLAGEVSLTGRATTPAGLVKNGHEWGSTEIELYNERRDNYVIKRKIIITNRTDRIEHKSEWSLNGRTATKSEIQKLITELNIKVDNLCQFLPQDSVASFVKMNSTELLTSTLKAAGDNELVTDQSKLIDLTKEILEGKSKLNRIKADCEHNEVNCARLEADVEKIRERERLVEMKKICDDKVYYVRYTEAKNHLDAAKQELQEMRDDLTRAQSSSEPYRRAAEANKEHVIRLKNHIQELSRDSLKTFERVASAKSKIDERKLDCQKKFTEFKSKQDEENQREKTILLKQQELQSLERTLVGLQTNNNQREIEALKEELLVLRDKLMQRNRNKSTIEDKLTQILRSLETVKTKIDQIKSVREKKMSLVMSRRPEAYKVIDWYSRNQDKFREKIFPPMMCEINVKDPRDAAVIEHSIHDSDLWAFVCQNEDDLKKLSNIARRELNAKINVILKPDKTMADFEAEAPQARYPGLPFKAWLKDLIEAPEPIMRYLCGNSQFHQTPVFNECTEQQLKYLLENCRKFYVNDKFYSVSTSRYDNQRITVSDSARAARLLVYSFDKRGFEECNREYARVSQAKDEADAERQNNIKEVDTLKRQWSDKQAQLNEMNSEAEKKKRIERLIERCKREIDELKPRKIDLEAERVKLQQAIARINLSMADDVRCLISIHKNCVETHEALCLSTLKHMIASRNCKISQRIYEDAIRDSKRLEEEVRKQKRRIQELMDVVDKHMQAATEKISGFDRGKLDKRSARKFQQIEETTVDALEQKIEELKAKIQGIHRDKSVINEFEKQNQELQDKRRKIADLESLLEVKDNELREIKNNWMPKLEEVIGEIDVHYRDFMRKLKYDGRVTLHFDESNPENFSTYGIMIMVKYRDDEQLKPLSPQLQSGGERSVATMIYMLALQTTTTVPFRCVDEINQGMDKDNERKVFELLVRISDESSAQYFLVSPKLLQNLPYSDKMKIHVVFNGPKLKLNWNELDSAGEQDGESNDEE